MRYRDINTIKHEKLKEAARFRKRERDFIESQADLFSIGIEYEFHVDINKVKQYIKKHNLDIDISHVLLDISDIGYQENDLFADYTYEDIYDSDVYKKAIKEIVDQEIDDIFQEVYQSDIKRRWNQYYNSYLESRPGNIEQAREYATQKTNEDSRDIKMQSQTEAKKSAREFAVTVVDEEFTDLIEEFMYQRAEVYNKTDVIAVRIFRDEYSYDPYVHMIKDSQPSEMINEEQIPELVEDLISISQEVWKIDIDKHIESIELDSSVRSGVEVITNPLMMKQAIDFYHKMCVVINDIGSTSKETGMHVNMSIENREFSDLNATKLLMILDPTLLQETFGLRANIRDVFSFINQNCEFFISHMIKRKNIVKSFDAFIDKNEKFLQINLNHMNEGSRSRIEFRYFGGEGYQDRKNTVIHHIYATAHAMFAAFNQEYLEKEYKKQIIRFVDKVFKDNYQRIANYFFDNILNNVNNSPAIESKDFLETKLFKLLENMTKQKISLSFVEFRSLYNKYADEIKQRMLKN